jgi:glucose-1-phosphate adenylyltransferase
LAGGRGSRLKNLTDWRAKPAVQFGGKFRIIDFPLSNCINSGIRRINVATQYKAQSLIQHVQRGWGFLRGEFNEYVNIIPAQQRLGEEWYKGTADAVYQNIDLLRENGGEYILVLAGDHIYKMDYGKMRLTASSLLTKNRHSLNPRPTILRWLLPAWAFMYSMPSFCMSN